MRAIALAAAAATLCCTSAAARLALTQLLDVDARGRPRSSRELVVNVPLGAVGAALGLATFDGRRVALASVNDVLAAITADDSAVERWQLLQQLLEPRLECGAPAMPTVVPLALVDHSDSAVQVALQWAEEEEEDAGRALDAADAAQPADASFFSAGMQSSLLHCLAAIAGEPEPAAAAAQPADSGSDASACSHAAAAFLRGGPLQDVAAALSDALARRASTASDVAGSAGCAVVFAARHVDAAHACSAGDGDSSSAGDGDGEDSAVCRLFRMAGPERGDVFWAAGTVRAAPRISTLSDACMPHVSNTHGGSAELRVPLSCVLASSSGEGAPVVSTLVVPDTPDAPVVHDSAHADVDGAVGDAVFLEAGGGAGADTHEASSLAALHRAIPGLSQIVQVFVKTLMPPVFDPALEKLNDHLQHTMSETTSKDVSSAVPDDVVRMLDPDLKRNLTNLLPDTITAAVTPALCKKLTDTLAPEIVDELIGLIEPDLTNRLVRGIHPLIMLRLDKTMPRMLLRSLRALLTEALTRSLTHSLVPALAASLIPRLAPQAATQFLPVAEPLGLAIPISHECAVCQANDSPVADKTDCIKCKREAAEMSILYRAHYAGEYYSKYHAQYMAKAVLAADLAQFPPDEALKKK